jgi:hypothetical protein
MGIPGPECVCSLRGKPRSRRAVMAVEGFRPSGAKAHGHFGWVDVRAEARTLRGRMSRGLAARIRFQKKRAVFGTT